MTVYTARRKNRILVWPTYDVAAAADTEDTGVKNRMTVWLTESEAAAADQTYDTTPEWVPDGALTHADFMNGLYWDGATVVAVGGLVGQNPGNWGPFNPATDIDSNGIISGSPILVGAALAAALGGSTLVFTFNSPTGNGDISCEAIKSADFSTDLYMNCGTNLSNFVLVKDFVANVSDSEAPGVVEGVNKVAFTLSATKLSASLNGDNIATCVATVATAIDEIVFSGTAQIRSLTIYPEQADGALVALSAP